LSEMMLDYIFAQVGLKPWSYQSLYPE
jgi:hypothetical protein